MNALRGDARERFISRVTAHLQRVFSQRYERMTTGEIHDFVSVGITKAESYGFVSERETCKYIDLMFMFGPDFDCAEPWASVFTLVSDRPAFDRALDEKYDSLFEGSGIG